MVLVWFFGIVCIVLNRIFVVKVLNISVKVRIVRIKL